VRVSLGYVGSTVGKICFVFDLILHIACTVDSCALTSILPSLPLIDMIYCSPDTTATPASVEGVGVDVYVDTDFVSPQHCEACSK
jgi:hypothetical protein